MLPAFLGDELEECLERGGEFSGAFLEEGFFHVVLVDFFVDFVEEGARGEEVDGAGVGCAGGFGGGDGLRGVGLDVAAGEGFEVFIGGIGGEFCAGGGEDDFLLEGEVFVFPEGLVGAPQAFGVDDADEALGGRGEGGDVFFAWSFVGEALGEEGGEAVVEAAGGQEVGDDKGGKKGGK